MIINQPGSNVEHYTRIDEYPHYYISSTNFKSDFKDKYFCYINGIRIGFYHDIYYARYWIEKEESCC